MPRKLQTTYLYHISQIDYKSAERNLKQEESAIFYIFYENPIYILRGSNLHLRYTHFICKIPNKLAVDTQTTK